MKFYINDEEIVEKDAKNSAKGENSETQVDVDRIVGMSHTMFKHIVALNTYTEPFLKETSPKQREIIEELLGVTQISSRAERLKAMIGRTTLRHSFSSCAAAFAASIGSRRARASSSHAMVRYTQPWNFT